MAPWSCAASLADAAIPAVNARSLLVREVAATPAQLRRLVASQPETFPALFDSAAVGPLGRHSVLAALPRASLLLRGDGRLESRGVRLRSPDFLGALDEWWAAEQGSDQTEVLAGGAPFRGGWVVFLGYEMAGWIEPGLRLPPLPADAVCALAVRVGAALVYDHERRSCRLVAEAEAVNAGARIERALDESTAGEAGVAAGLGHPGVVTEQDPEVFRAAVLRAQEHIANGDVYQANLSRGWRLRLGGQPDPGALYESLRRANPAPFAVYANLPSLTLLSSSPERLVRVCGRQVDTRPIAGTRARRGAAGSDDSERRELLANAKERAEHVMLIDLERNDLGRICEAGSVEVDEFMVTESYPHLHHIVSNVRGRLRPGVTPGATLRAVFPGGTITGCPKYRCMQIIGELEGEARGAYTGSMGYINVNGDMDFNILIRTATLAGAELRFRTGAGIVADSDWQRELAETRTKAQGLLRAFGGGA
jgi:anthranilate synthase component I